MEDANHAARVDHWLGLRTHGLTETQKLSLFQEAVATLWRRAHVTLGEVTLGAVTERVLYHAKGKYPFLSPLVVGAEGIQFNDLEGALAAVNDRSVTEAFRYLLIELLSVLGNLTSEIITPELHSELLKVALSKAKQKRKRGPSRSQKRSEPTEQ